VLTWARRYVDALDPILPVDGVTERVVAVDDDRFPSAGLRDALRQIEFDVHSISRDLPSLDTHSWRGRRW